MSRFQFDLKLMFLVVTNVCVIAWGIVALRNESLLFLVAPAVSALSAALSAGRSANRAMMLGAIGGSIGAAALPIGWGWLNDIGYFFHTGPGGYFEDGAIAEVVIFPIGYAITWGPLGAVFGMFIGSFVAAFITLKKKIAGAANKATEATRA